MSNQRIILYAAGSPLIVDFEEICIRNEIEISAIINNLSGGKSYALSQDKVILKNTIETIKEIPFICTLFSPQNRLLAVNEALSLGLKPFNILVDKSSDIPIYFKHGNGCFINKRVTIGSSAKIGDFVTINRGATLGHHLLVEDFVSIGPGVVSGGNVTIKEKSLIGTGAVLLPKITIGKNAIVGAGAVVTKDVPDYAVVVGNPGKVIKINDA
ncbi:acetyltransferase [uncultured Draconibacterium sp.]|uniref:acetyltransferase n=1 Tax=uncultured Draconibacterium sp. TaxID=1573823 RepID=UPI002AA87EC0|nr:acetyltransferase [uncultured Draconibacterium sp.]